MLWLGVSECDFWPQSDGFCDFSLDKALRLMDFLFFPSFMAVDEQCFLAFIKIGRE